MRLEEAPVRIQVVLDVGRDENIGLTLSPLTSHLWRITQHNGSAWFEYRPGTLEYRTFRLVAALM